MRSTRGSGARSQRPRGGERAALVFVPPSLGAAPEASGDSEVHPPALLFVLHGNGGNGAGMASATRFHEFADRERIVVAYPDGLAGAWNCVRGIPGYPETPDDVSFLADMAAELERVYGTDPERTYVVGYSNGGFMARRLACDAPDRFAAFVAVAAGGFAGLDGICTPAAPVSIAFVHGTADTNVPWGGLPVPVPGGFVELTWPLPATFAWWAERAACDPPAIRTELAGNPAAGVDAVIVFTLERCAHRRVVALFGLRGGGHAWPTGSGFDASLAAWSFVRDQTPR